MPKKLGADELLCQALIILLMFGYAVMVFMLVIAIGGLPLGLNRSDAQPPWWLSLAAFALIGLTALPVHRWVRAGVRSLVYGQHENPYPVLSQINEHLETTQSPQTILPTIAEAIAQTLKLPYIKIEAQPLGETNADQRATAIFGDLPRGVKIERVPLTYHGISVGEMHVAARRWDDPLSPADLLVLRDLARQVGIALYAAQLTGDLQRARERLVMAREEERRRIRNDLHDGLAPTLSSLQLQLGVVRSLLRKSPEQAEALLVEMGDDLRTTTAEIRRLVYDLRPPRLDELGLVGAIRSINFQGAGIRLEVEAPEPMPRLPAAVEVAVFRVAGEAVHNVVKHAQASECSVRIEIGDGLLTLTVSDDGKSLPYEPERGVGLESMRERVAELGGSFLVNSCETGGTCVTAQFPLSD